MDLRIEDAAEVLSINKWDGSSTLQLGLRRYTNTFIYTLLMQKSAGQARDKRHLGVIYFSKFLPHGQRICHDLHPDMLGGWFASGLQGISAKMSETLHLTWMVVFRQAVDDRRRRILRQLQEVFMCKKASHNDIIIPVKEHCVSTQNVCSSCQ